MNLKNHIVIDPIYEHESRIMGGGCPPVETEQGWLLIYHGAEKQTKDMCILPVRPYWIWMILQE